MSDEPPASQVVHNAWAEFDRAYLTLLEEGATAEARGLARAAFYFGCLAMLNLCSAVVDNARNAGAVNIAFDAMQDEIDDFMQSHSDQSH